MVIGVPRERKQGERRVAMTPDGARLLTAKGHTILIERDAGGLSGFTDADFRDCGATIVDTLAAVWGGADLVVKVKEPDSEEFPLFRPGLGVFSFLHPAVAPAMMRALLDHQVVGLDYDLVEDDFGRLPILEPMSIIAGKLAIQCGASALQAHNDGAGVLLGGLPGVIPGRVVVLGAGAAGRSAAEVAIGMGAEVCVIDINPEKLKPFSGGYYRAETVHSSPAAIRRAVESADLVVGAVLIPGALAPKLLTRDMIRSMPARSVFVDICIDQGGCSETSRTTSISSPTYVEEGVIHFCVPNMPALVPRTSTWGLTNATIRWVSELADRGVESAIRDLKPLKRSVVSYRGELTNDEIGKALNIPSVAF